MAKKEEKNIKDKTSFMKSFKAELKKVIWPTPKQLFNNTIAVLVIVVITAAIVFVLDFAFESMNKYGIDKIKEVVSNSTNESIDNTTDSENETDENNNVVNDDENTSANDIVDVNNTENVEAE